MHIQKIIKCLLVGFIFIPLSSCVSNQKFLYRFYDMNRATILKEGYENSGFLITAPNNPEPFSQNGKKYLFSHWDGYQSGQILTSDVDFYAVYTSTTIKYNYSFINEGSVISKGKLSYGETIPLPNDPIHSNDDLYSYVFEGWSNYKKDMTITKDTVFEAQYTKYAKVLSTLVNETNESVVHLEKGNFGTIAFNHNNKVSTIKTGYCNDYYAKLYNDIPSASNMAIEMVAYERILDFTFLGSDDYRNPDPNLAHQSILEGLDIYGGAFYANENPNPIHQDPLGLAKKCEGKKYGNYRQWMETVHIKNLTIKNCTFKGKYGFRLSLGLAAQINNETSEYGTVTNISFENCSFLDIKKREQDYINSTNCAIYIGAREQRQLGMISIKNCTFDGINYDDANYEVNETNGSAIYTSGFHNAVISNNYFNRCAHNAIGISGGGGITGFVNIENNSFNKTLSRAIRLHSTNCAILKNKTATLNIYNNEFKNIGLNEESNCFIKASLANTTYSLPYTFEVGDDHRLQIKNNRFYSQKSSIPLTIDEINDGTKNCDIYSGSGPNTYLDGVFVNG